MVSLALLIKGSYGELLKYFYSGKAPQGGLKGVTSAQREPGEDHGNRTSILTIPFIHHCSDDHREHATVQVKVQLRERNELRLHNSHQTCLKTTLGIISVQWRAFLTDAQFLVSEGHERAEGFKIPGTNFKRESTTTYTLNTSKARQRIEFQMAFNGH